ncbi:hypothetical protein FQN50_004129 [Emmonsiellopsis sp. PD_5]|nr:hypothetical protein FQN50_004129 [Emmonsiellopsis sp. PD_5]
MDSNEQPPSYNSLYPNPNPKRNPKLKYYRWKEKIKNKWQLLRSIRLDLGPTYQDPAIVDIHLVPGGGRKNYTGFVTKTIVYVTTFFVFLAAFALTLASIALPRWVSSHRGTSSGISYGLHRRCFTQSNSQSCERFPQYDDCQGDQNRYFCSMWRTTGFLMSFAVVLEGMTLITYLVILLGGKQARENGWRVLALLLVVVGVVQSAGMGLVSYLVENDDHFFLGWKLDDSWIMCTVSWCLALLSAVAVVVAARVLPAEGGYELIADYNEGGGEVYG